MADGFGSIQVAEILHYFSDYEATREFYIDKLRWTEFYAAEGELLILDVRGHYQIGLVNARWTPGWSMGQPVPQPRLSIECQDVQRVHEVLTNAGCEVSSIGGDPATMLTLELTDNWGNHVYFWEDTVKSGAASGVEHKPFSAAQQLKGIKRGDSPYGFAETLYYVTDLPMAEAWYKQHLGFETAVRHGESYSALQIDQGRTLGLLNWQDWFDQPEPNSAPAPPRLSLMVFDIAAEYARLKDTGIEVGELRSSGDGLHWFTFADPDGTLISMWRYKRP